jgi:hypothetical protein
MQWRIVLRHDQSGLRDPVRGVCDKGPCMAAALAGMPQPCPKVGERTPKVRGSRPLHRV